MKNLIRGVTLILIVAVFCLTGCTAARITKNRQSLTQTEQSKSETATGVAGQRSEQAAQKLEELLQGQTTTITTLEGIPESLATVDVPIQNLLNLPDGAEYTAKDGQASVSVQRNGDNITVTGKCDSIARQCLFYEQEVFRRRSEADSLRETISRMEALQTEKETVDHTEQNLSESVKEKPPAWYKWLLAGFIAGILASSPLKRITNKVFIFIKRIYGKE